MYFADTLWRYMQAIAQDDGSKSLPDRMTRGNSSEFKPPPELTASAKIPTSQIGENPLPGHSALAFKLPTMPMGVDAFLVGDIVRATLGGPIRYEGVVVDIDTQQELLRVDFGDTVESLPVEQCIKVLSWDHLEVGDKVQVRPEGLFQYFTGSVIKVNLDGTYNVQYEDSEDVENNVQLSNIRKLATGRTMASRRWKAVIHAVRTTTALAGLMRKKARSESFDSSN